MASVVEICNRALQKLGAKRITSLTENSPNARSCNVAYEPVKLSELRRHTWSCAIKRAQLASDATAPLFTRTKAYTLPSDFLRLLPLDPEVNTLDFDWQIESGKIITNDSSPINVRYIYNLTDPNQMDALFREALSARLAMELCEEITESSARKEGLKRDYKEIIADAYKVNAIERVALEPPEDVWVTVRQ